MVDPYFVTSDDSVQEDITFFFIAIQICWQMSKHVCLCSIESYFGTHLAQTLWKPSLLWMISYAEPWLICRQFATSSIVGRLSDRTMARMRLMLSSVVVVDSGPAPSWWHLCDHFLIFLSIRRHSVAAKHCSRIVLKVFGVFRPLIHLQTTKNGSLNTALPWCKWKVEQPWLTLRLQQRNWPSNFKPAQLW